MKKLTDEALKALINKHFYPGMAPDYSQYKAFALAAQQAQDGKLLPEFLDAAKRNGVTHLTITQPEPQLFEFWWAEYMPEATQEQAFKAWSAAPSSKGVGVGQQAQPEPEPLNYVQVGALLTEAGYINASPQARCDYIAGIRDAEQAHDIKQGGKQ